LIEQIDEEKSSSSSSQSSSQSSIINHGNHPLLRGFRLLTIIPPLSSIGAARNEKKCSVPRLGLLHFQRYPPAIGGDHTPAQMVVSNFWPQNAISLPGASSKNENLKVG
jgi:hypothetical protein